jgi:YHS domain-containing protein
MRSLLLALTTVIAISAVYAQDLKPYYNVDDDGLWVEGYDPVAYLLDRKAEKGSAAFTATYQGATFRFTGRAHLDAFKADPLKYLPQYGGYCAFAIGDHKEKVEVDPETFTIKDGKVFLFYNAFFNNTLDDWKADEPRLHMAADRNWATFKHTH